MLRRSQLEKHPARRPGRLRVDFYPVGCSFESCRGRKAAGQRGEWSVRVLGLLQEIAALTVALTYMTCTCRALSRL